MGRRIVNGESLTFLLTLGTVLLTVRTLVSLVTNNAFVYFALPAVCSFGVGVFLSVTAVRGRPAIRRFVLDLCPLDKETLSSSAVSRLMVKVSYLWTAALVVEAAATLVAPPLRARGDLPHRPDPRRLGDHGVEHRRDGLGCSGRRCAVKVAAHGCRPTAPTCNGV